MELHHAFLVCCGGAIGSLARWAVGVLLFGKVPPQLVGFPWATLAVNVLGSFALGTLAAWCATRPGWRAFTVIGLCGGFTTMSSFSFDAVEMSRAGQWGMAGGYAASTLIGCLGGVWLGAECVK